MSFDVDGERVFCLWDDAMISMTYARNLVEGHGLTWSRRGDAVVIRTLSGRDLGRGLIAYGSVEAAQIIGKKSKAIAEILGFEGRAELIHRDDMALER